MSLAERRIENIMLHARPGEDDEVCVTKLGTQPPHAITKRIFKNRKAKKSIALPPPQKKIFSRQKSILFQNLQENLTKNSENPK